MRKVVFSMFIAFLSLLVSILMTAAQAEEAKHSCQESELAGLWQTAGFNENPPGQLTENFKKFPYEYLIFDYHGNLAFDGRQVAADVNFKSKDDLTSFVKEVYSHSKLAGKFNFKLDGGILTILRDENPWQKFQCFIVDADMTNGMKKDDMIWLSPSAIRIERHVFK